MWRRFFPTEDAFPAAPPRVLTVDTSIAAVEVIASSDYWAIVPERFARRAVHAGHVFVAHDAPERFARQNHYLLRRDDRAR